MSLRSGAGISSRLFFSGGTEGGGRGIKVLEQRRRSCQTTAEQAKLHQQSSTEVPGLCRGANALLCEPSQTTDAAFVAQSENLLLLWTVVSLSRTAAASSRCMEALPNFSGASLAAPFLQWWAAAGHSGMVTAEGRWWKRDSWPENGPGVLGAPEGGRHCSPESSSFI